MAGVQIFTDVVKSPLIISKLEDTIRLPKAVLVNEFTESSAKKFYEDMTEVENLPQDVIPIFIDSYGGAVYSLLAMIDCIKSSRKKICTVSLSKSMSCGAILLSCGDEGLRFSSPTSTIMIHDVATCSGGKVSEVKVDAEEAERLNLMIYETMNANTGHEKGYFQGIVHDKNHADWFLTPSDARSHNLVNHIRIPRFKVSVSVETEFVV